MIVWAIRERFGVAIDCGDHEGLKADRFRSLSKAPSFLPFLNLSLDDGSHKFALLNQRGGFRP